MLLVLLLLHILNSHTIFLNTSCTRFTPFIGSLHTFNTLFTPFMHSSCIILHPTHLPSHGSLFNAHSEGLYNEIYKSSMKRYRQPVVVFFFFFFHLILLSPPPVPPPSPFLLLLLFLLLCLFILPPPISPLVSKSFLQTGLNNHHSFSHKSNVVSAEYDPSHFLCLVLSTCHLYT